MYSALAELLYLVSPLLGYCFMLAPLICTLYLCIVLAQSYGKSVAFGLGLFFLPVIFFCILAFGNRSAAKEGMADIA